MVNFDRRATEQPTPSHPEQLAGPDVLRVTPIPRRATVDRVPLRSNARSNARFVPSVEFVRATAKSDTLFTRRSFSDIPIIIK